MRHAMRRTFLAALLLVAAPALAEDEDAAEVAADFLGMVGDMCMPWVTEGRAPDITGYVPFDETDPVHVEWGRWFPDAAFAPDGRTQVTWGSEDGLRICGLTFFEAAEDFTPTPLANAVARGTGDWIRALGQGPDWDPKFTCVQLGFGFFLTYQRAEPLRPGFTVQLLASTGGDHRDPATWGAFATINVTEEPVAERPTCIGDQG